MALFFVVSGFVIAEAMDVFYPDRLKNFLKNRFLRIYPPYLFALFAAVVFLFIAVTIHHYGVAYQPNVLEPYVMGNFSKLFWNLIAIFDPRNVYGNDNYAQFVRTLWTIVLEIEFYLFMALIVALKLEKRRVIILVVTVYALHYIFVFPSIFRIVEFIPYFLVGIFIYHRRVVLAVLAAIMAVYSFASWIGHAVDAYDVYISSILFVFFLLVFYALTKFRRQSARLKNLDVALGDISYPLYLNHYIIGLILCAFFPKSPLLLIFGVMISIVVSCVAYLIVEPPIKNIRNRIRGRSF